MDHDVHLKVQSAYLFVVSVVLSHSILLVGRVLEERNSGHKQQNCGVKDEKRFLGEMRARFRMRRQVGGHKGGWIGVLSGVLSGGIDKKHGGFERATHGG